MYTSRRQKSHVDIYPRVIESRRKNMKIRYRENLARVCKNLASALESTLFIHAPFKYYIKINKRTLLRVDNRLEFIKPFRTPFHLAWQRRMFVRRFLLVNIQIPILKYNTSGNVHSLFEQRTLSTATEIC